MDETLLQERAARCRTLARIESLIKQTTSQHVEPSYLKAASIHHLPLSLEADTKYHPRFFKPYEEQIPLPQQDKEDKLSNVEPDPLHIMWDTRDMEIFFTHYFNECLKYASEMYPDNHPPSGICREYVALWLSLVF